MENINEYITVNPDDNYDEIYGNEIEGNLYYGIC